MLGNASTFKLRCPVVIPNYVEYTVKHASICVAPLRIYLKSKPQVEKSEIRPLSVTSYDLEVFLLESAFGGSLCTSMCSCEVWL